MFICICLLVLFRDETRRAESSTKPTVSSRLVLNHLLSRPATEQHTASPDVTEVANENIHIKNELDKTLHKTNGNERKPHNSYHQLAVIGRVFVYTADTLFLVLSSSSLLVINHASSSLIITILIIHHSSFRPSRRSTSHLKDWR